MCQARDDDDDNDDYDQNSKIRTEYFPKEINASEVMASIRLLLFHKKLLLNDTEKEQQLFVLLLLAGDLLCSAKNISRVSQFISKPSATNSLNCQINPRASLERLQRSLKSGLMSYPLPNATFCRSPVTKILNNECN